MEAPTFLHMLMPNIPPYVSYSWLAMLLLIVPALLIRNKLALVPSGLQNVMETFAEFFLNMANTSIGHHWGETFYPLLGTLGLYILVSNLFGLVPGFESPTSNINATASMAIPVFLATHYYGIKVHGFKYLNHFVGPIRNIYALPLMIMMFFIELIGHLVRPVTLSVRLFGNMVAKHIILVVLAVLAPLLVPTLILALGTLVSLIQAYVFVLLTTLYLAGAVEEGH